MSSWKWEIEHFLGRLNQGEETLVPKCTVMRETPDVGETEDDLTCGPHCRDVELYFWAYIVIQSRQDSTYLCTSFIHPVEALMIINLGSLVSK